MAITNFHYILGESGGRKEEREINYNIDLGCGSMEEEGWQTQGRTKCELAWDVLESWACFNGTRFNLDKYKLVPDSAQHVTVE